MTDAASLPAPPARPPKTDYSIPVISWPTISLFLGCIMVWTLAFYAAVSGYLPYGAAVIINAVAAFAMFTPMHDASHRSVSRIEWINESLGRIGILLLIGPFTAFRFVHLEHHRHTNDEVKDPDHWSGRGPKWALPLRWATQDLYYYVVYLRRWNDRDVAERWETLITLLVLYGGIAALCFAGFTAPVLLLWVLPARIAQGLLAYSFDYLPHKPHKVTAREDRFRATSVLLHPLLSLVMLFQNYHLIHHLYPGVPFYRYPDIWKTQREYLLAHGAHVIGHDH